jgi:hypothetical protein
MLSFLVDAYLAIGLLSVARVLFVHVMQMGAVSS